MQRGHKESAEAELIATAKEKGAEAAIVAAANQIEIENGKRARRLAVQRNASPSPNQVQIELLQCLSEETINKVSRLVASRRMMGNVGAYIADEIRQGYETLTKLRAGRPLQGRTEGDEEVLAGKLRLVEMRIAAWQAQQKEIAAKRSAAINVADSLLKTIRQELGGGIYGEEIFELLGWRGY
ncbi:MAG: hypothetical protein ACTJG9_08745 [Alcaligenes aquatilis]